MWILYIYSVLYVSQCSQYDIVVSQENHIMIAKCIYKCVRRLQHIPFWLLKNLRDAKINKNNLARAVAEPSGISLSSLHRPRTKQTTKLSSFNLNQNVYEFGMRAIRYTLFCARTRNSTRRWRHISDAVGRADEFSIFTCVLSNANPLGKAKPKKI